MLFGSTFLHNHYIYPLSIACSALGHCQGLSLISRFRYSHCHCFSSIWLFTFWRVTFHTWARKCSIRQYHRQSDHCFTPTCTAVNINFLCAMCKYYISAAQEVRSKCFFLSNSHVQIQQLCYYIYKAQTSHYTNVQLFHAHTPSYHLAHAQRRSRPAP